MEGGTVDDVGSDIALALVRINDLSDPVWVLSAVRSMVAPDGSVVVMDERVGESFAGDEDPVEQLRYRFSLVCCLHDGRNATESAATGTVIRQPTFERYGCVAGFAAVEVLSIEHDFLRFNRLTF